MVACPMATVIMTILKIESTKISGCEFKLGSGVDAEGVPVCQNDVVGVGLNPSLLCQYTGGQC